MTRKKQKALKAWGVFTKRGKLVDVAMTKYIAVTRVFIGQTVRLIRIPITGAK